jgi:prevent-host-death family protein
LEHPDKTKLTSRYPQSLADLDKSPRLSLYETSVSGTARIATEVMAIALRLWSCYYDHTRIFGRMRLMKEMPAGQFKSQCLAIMDQVQESGEPVLITKHGKPVAKLVPIKKTGDDIFGYMIGKARIMGDIMNSVPPEDWDSK